MSFLYFFNATLTDYNSDHGNSTILINIDTDLYFPNDSLSIEYCLNNNINTIHQYSSILVMWLECRFLDTDVDGSNLSINMFSP